MAAIDKDAQERLNHLREMASLGYFDRSLLAGGDINAVAYMREVDSILGFVDGELIEEDR